MKDTMIRFRDGSIGTNNTCSRYTPTSPMLILLICFSTTRISSKEHIWIKSSRTKDWMKGTTDKLQIDDRSTSVTKGRKRNPKGTTKTQPREFLDSKRGKRAGSKHAKIRGE